MALQIVHLCRTASPRVGGLEGSVQGLASAQRARGHRVRLVSLRDPGFEGALPGLEVVRLVRLGPRRYPFALGLERALLGAEIVHVHGIDGLLDQLVRPRLRARPYRVGVSTHGGYFHTPRQAWLKELTLRSLTAWSLRRADAVWFTSEVDRARFAPAGVEGAVLPNGIEVERFEAVSRRPEPGLLLVLGRVDVHKGIDDLIDALPEALQRRPELSVQVVGPEQVPGLVARYQQRASERGVAHRLAFPGSLTGEALLAALGRAERVVLPSRHEGFGLAALEAMAARVPVLASDIGAFRAHGAHLQRIDFRRPGALAQALLQPPDPAQVEGARAYARTFGWAERALAFEEAYLALLGGRGGRS